MTACASLAYYRRPMKIPLTLLIVSVATAAPGLWLMLRHQSRSSAFLASLLLLAATGSGYTGIRLWHEGKRSQPSYIEAPVASPATAGQFRIITPEQLPDALTQSRGRPVMLEFYADWCPSCVVMKEKVFHKSEVQRTLEPFVLLQIDATELSPQIQAQLDHYGIPGLPAILVYDRTGNERPEFRLLGEMEADEFIAWVNGTLLKAM